MLSAAWHAFLLFDASPLPRPVAPSRRHLALFAARLTLRSVPRRLAPVAARLLLWLSLRLHDPLQPERACGRLVRLAPSPWLQLRQQLSRLPRLFPALPASRVFPLPLSLGASSRASARERLPPSA